MFSKNKLSSLSFYFSAFYPAIDSSCAQSLCPLESPHTAQSPQGEEQLPASCVLLAERQARTQCFRVRPHLFLFLFLRIFFSQKAKRKRLQKTAPLGLLSASNPSGAVFWSSFFFNMSFAELGGGTITKKAKSVTQQQQKQKTDKREREGSTRIK